MKNKYDSLIFDLDGTLWNSCETCAEGWGKALMQLGVDRQIQAKDIESIAGLVFSDIIDTLLPGIDIDRKLLFETINFYEIQALKEKPGKLYPHVIETLLQLRQKYTIFLVSNCQHWYLENFLQQFSLHNIFMDWESHGRTRLTKGENIAKVMKRNELQSPLYIGDTPGDLEAALSIEIDFVHAKYGYKKLEHPCGIDSIDELVNLLL